MPRPTFEDSQASKLIFGHDGTTEQAITADSDGHLKVDLDEPISVSFFDARVAVTDFPDDTVWSGLIEALDDDVTADPGGMTTFGVSIVTWDDWVGTFVFEASVNGVAYFSCPVVNSETGTVITSATEAGIFTFPCAGYMRLRVRASAYTTGSSLITLRGSIGTNTGSIPLSDTQLRATAVPVSGPLTAVELKISNFGQTLLEILYELKAMNTHLSLITDEEV